MENIRLLLRMRLELASPSRTSRFEASYAGSFVPGTFATRALAEAAALSYLERRPSIDHVQIIGDDSGELLATIRREP